MRALRSLLIFKVGVWVGMMGAAAFVKRSVPSHGDEESDDLSLVAVMDGIKLKSRSQNLRGGSLLAWYGGIDLDLSEAELAPDARFSVRTLFGGIAIDTPPGWRVESSVKTFGGGVDAKTQDDPDAPVLAIEGTAVFGGVAVGSRRSTANV